MKKEVVAADAEWATIPVSGSSYSFSAAAEWVTAADVAAETTAVSGSSYFSSAVAEWAMAADVDADANNLTKIEDAFGILYFCLSLSSSHLR